jgi:hypothetical protein
VLIVAELPILLLSVILAGGLAFDFTMGELGVYIFPRAQAQLPLLGCTLAELLYPVCLTECTSTIRTSCLLSHHGLWTFSVDHYVTAWSGRPARIRGRDLLLSRLSSSGHQPLLSSIVQQLLRPLHLRYDLPICLISDTCRLRDNSQRCDLNKFRRSSAASIGKSSDLISNCNRKSC